jgi:predicted nucleic acid-binding protein
MVVDAAVVIRAIQEPRSAARSALAPASILAAPELIDLEVASVLRRRVEIQRTMTAAVASRVLHRMELLPIRRHSHRGLIQRIWSLRHNLTPYDASYVALAEQLGLPLITGDARLAQAPGITCSVVVVT